MTATRERIYQASDLAGTNRRAFLEEARTGQAHLRTPEGESLVMLREAHLTHLAAMHEHAVAYYMLDNALTRSREDRRPADFGPWAFIAEFDDEDIEDFRAEMNSALIRAASVGDLDLVESTLADWRRSARTLADPVAREILFGDVSADDWVEVERPQGDE